MLVACIVDKKFSFFGLRWDCFYFQLVDMCLMVSDSCVIPIWYYGWTKDSCKKSGSSPYMGISWWLCLKHKHCTTLWFWWYVFVCNFSSLTFCHSLLWVPTLCHLYITLENFIIKEIRKRTFLPWARGHRMLL